MRLSEAIRLGSMLREQNKGGYLQDNKTCAMGAAFDAIGAFAVGQVQCSGLPVLSFSYKFPIIEQVVEHPTVARRQSVMEIIFYLNDTLGWIRPRIADWVEEVEKSFEQVPTPVEEPQEVRV